MDCGRRFLAVVCVGVMVAMGVDGEVWGQGCAPGASMEAKGGMGATAEGAGRPVRMEGIGNARIEMTTSNAEARLWFLQGLNLLHDFWDYESERAFRESVRLDPKCAMCWWVWRRRSTFGMTTRRRRKFR